MMKKNLFFLLLALLLIMSGCGTNSQAPNSSASTSAPTESSGSAGSTQPDQEGFLTNQNEPLTHASALGLYESLDVSEDQRVEILDMNEDYIFLSVNYDAFEIELTREVGFTYMSEKLVLLEYPNMNLVSEILLPSAVYCTSGALFDDGYSYSTITISDSIESDYSIYYHSNQSEAPDALIDHGKCYAVDFNIPSLLTMDSGKIVYSYTNLENGTLGISTILPGGKLRSNFEYAFTDDGLGFLGNLKTNGNQFMIFLELDGVRGLLLGDTQSDCSFLPSAEGEQIFDYCLLESTFLCSLRRTDINSIEYLEERDFTGSTIKSMKYPSVYRMVSDGQDCALGINGKYQIIAIRVEDQTAAIYRDTEMTLPVLFYEISDGAFGAHFYNAVYGPRSLSTFTFF